ncbi:MAG TPA: N-6 DNA methylase [Synergistaceae bacterium]|nr:N-6 DNA methylase [Synergistaceae bacterium]
MESLDRALRSQLENAVRKARDLSESAVRAALNLLGVAETRPPSHLRESDKALRLRLRAHGRQLGDGLNGGKEQSMEHLVEEGAYEHWHRMLFARFLAENNLLMYTPRGEERPVDISLATCQALIDEKEEAASSKWELASRLAARMLPQIFRPDSPIFALSLLPEHQRALEELAEGLPPQIFVASDALGWVYQFWQSKKKDEVNEAGIKIGARELPAVTQLFTEPYMVSFLLDNSLGAWWAARRLSDDDRRHAADEEELRRRAALPGVPLSFLRFVPSDEGVWGPAAGTFGDWPEELADLKTLDPCCGSGHFLVAALLMLTPLRMHRENLSPREAVDAVLRDNLHGLELDRRCVELAAFALALAAWKYPGAGGYRPLPELHLACSGAAPGISKKEWTAQATRLAQELIRPREGELVEGEAQNSLLRKDRLQNGMDNLYDYFQNAPELGSLLAPDATGDLFGAGFGEVAELVTEALRRTRDEEPHEAGVVAHGLAKALQLLLGRYHWVTTNVPYLARGKQGDALRTYCERRYPEAKNDLATVFLDRCLEFCVAGGTAAIVLPQNWLFLTTYRKFREKLLRHHTWRLIARMGPGAFETISGEVVKAILIVLSRGKPRTSPEGKSHRLYGVDVSEPRTAAEKAAQLPVAAIKGVEQEKQLENPDARVALEKNSGGPLLEMLAYSHEGLTTGDIDRFVRKRWEIQESIVWINYIQNTTDCIHYNGRTDIIHWGDKGEMVANFPGSFIKGENAWSHIGLRVTQMRHLPITIYTGEVFGKNAATVIPHNPAHLPAIWCFCSSPEYNEAVRRIDQKLNVTNATLVKVPFDLDRWTREAEERYPHGLPKPYSDDPTQWIFHGHPCGSVVWDEEQKWTASGPLRTDDTVLQVAVARLLGYRWPAELDEGMELAEEQRAWVRRCEPLRPLADEDGLVCIPSVRGELPAADRLLALLARAYGDQWHGEVLARLLRAVGHGGGTLESWLREEFFSQHCRFFQQRPFIWHIWDGLPDGFAALVNYHKLDHRRLERLTYAYLGDWITRRAEELNQKVPGAQTRLDAAEALKKKLKLILEGEAPYDIFVRWKPLAAQPLGWEPDLNDGVRLNIRPFLSVPDVKKKGAGVLRDRPHIKWDKDRGRDVPSAPWYSLGPRYGGNEGDRINDHHLALAEKRAAREGT